MLHQLNHLTQFKTVNWQNSSQKVCHAKHLQRLYILIPEFLLKSDNIMANQQKKGFLEYIQ